MPITERGAPNPLDEDPETGTDAGAEPPLGGEEVNVPVFPNPDAVQLERFVGVLFEHADPKGFVSLRAFPHKENSPTAFVEPITLDNPQFCEVVTERDRQA